MIISAYAFAPDEELIFEDRVKRCKELEGIEGFEVRRSPAYNKVHFHGSLTTPEAQALSEYDIAILVDSMCFGGTCVKNGMFFHGHYWTD